MIINDNLATLVLFNSSILESKSTSEGVSSNADKHNIDIKRALCVILGVLNVQMDTLLFIVNSGIASRVEHELESLLLERLCEHFTDFLVEEWANAFCVLQDSNLSSQSSVHATELETNDTAADNGHLLWDLLEFEGAS